MGEVTLVSTVTDVVSTYSMADVLTLDRDDLDLALSSSLWGRYCYHPSFTGEKIEAHRS